MARRQADQALAVPATPLRVDGHSGFDPSRVLTLRQIIREVPGKFRSAYGRDRERLSWRGDRTIGKIIEDLAALDAETATPADVSSIIGNDSWTDLECDHCGRQVEAAVSLGQEPDYESRTALVCRDCLNAAAIAIEAATAGETVKQGSTRSAKARAEGIAQ